MPLFLPFLPYLFHLYLSPNFYNDIVSFHFIITSTLQYVKLSRHAGREKNKPQVCKINNTLEVYCTRL